MPLETAETRLIDEGNASLLSESIRLDLTIGLGQVLGTGGSPVVELKTQTYYNMKLS